MEKNKKIVSKRSKLPRIFSVAMIVALWIGVIFFAQPLGRTLLVDQPREEAIRQHLQTRAVDYVHRLDNYMADLARHAEVIAKAAVHPSGEDNSLPLAAQPTGADQANNGFPEIISISLLTEFPSTPPLAGNYAAQFLFEKTMAGQALAPLAAMVDQWAIYIARPIKNGDSRHKVLLITANTDGLKRTLEKAGLPEGQLRLEQEVNQGRIGAVLDIGHGANPGPSTRLATNIPGWYVRLTANKNLIEELSPAKTLFYVSLATLYAIAIFFSLWLFGHSTSQAPTPIPKKSRLDPQDDLFTQQFRRFKVTTEALSPTEQKSQETINASAPPDTQLPTHVFREYDIRGKADTEITSEFAHLLGKVLGTKLLGSGHDQLMVGADGRLSSPSLKKSLIEAVLSTGCNVIDIGQAPTPVLNFALATSSGCRSGVMVTASHNPSTDNGFKIIVDGRVLSSEQIPELRQLMLEGDFSSGEGTLVSEQFIDRYLQAICTDVVPPTDIKLVVDCGNGVAGTIAPDLFRSLDCNVIELFTDVDGHFPNHPPDPIVEENLRALKDSVAQHHADLGLAFDGDGDRLVAITASGRIVWPDELMMIFARDVATRRPGADIIFDVKSTRRLREVIVNYGARPIMWKTGHAHLRNKMAESQAPLAGEYSGHIFFNDRWHGFDDGLYAAARLLEIIALREQGLDELISSFPTTYSTGEIKIPIPEERKYQLMEQLVQEANFGDAQIVTVDGLRVECADGWGLVRVSNTSAALTLRFEADSVDSLERIKNLFKDHFRRITPELTLDF